MKRSMSVLMGLLFCAVLPVFAEEAVFSDSASTDTSVTDWRSELDADRAKIQEEKADMKENAAAAHAEERGLRKQIHEARKSGDTAQIRELQSKLKATHRENVGEMKQDKQALREANRDFWADRQQARRDQRRR